MTSAPGRDQRAKEDTDLLTRTSWVNAEVAYKQIKKGKADGSPRALWLRCKLQRYLYCVGSFIQINYGKVLFVGLLLLSLCCIGLKTASLETNVEKLWVEEGGRLEKELNYIKETVGEGSGTTPQIVIQTPRRNSNILTTDSFLLHLQSVLLATKVTITMFDVTWRLDDMCLKTSFPTIEFPFFDQFLDQIIPCVIMSPLDCFWEGSKLLGPNRPFHLMGGVTIKWIDFNPKKYVKSLQKHDYYGSPSIYEPVLDLFERAGITSGYQEKPCLDPSDPQCPSTAPNRQTFLPPDIGAELTNGCNGFATKFMHWEEDLLVGGVRKNKTGHIVKAEALQSIIQLMGEKQMYDFHSESNKFVGSGIDWTEEKAKLVLEAWQRKFAEVVNNFGKNETHKDNVYGFGSASLSDIMKEFSSVSTTRVVLGYILMVVYSCVSLLQWNDAINSQSGIGMVGVFLVALSVAAGLGMCSVLGIPFNASTTQIIPFLALGLGVDDMFLLAHTYIENSYSKNIPSEEQVGECLKRTGVSIFLTSFSNMLAFFAAAIIPIPALRAFSLQVGILILFNLATIMLIFPAIISLDLVRKEEKRIDVLCCFQSPSETNRVIDLQPRINMRERTPPPAYPGFTPPPSYSTVMMHNAITQASPDGGHPVTILAPNDGAFVTRNSPLSSACPSTTSSQQCLTPDESITCKQRCVKAQQECLSMSITSLATNHFGPQLTKTSIKVFVVVFSLVFLVLGIYGTAKVKDGLELTDIVPRDTTEYKFLEESSKYFGFYNVYAITQEDFDYPKNQKLYHDYYNAFQRVDSIVKTGDGTLPVFWLELFRQWLAGLQQTFDRDFAEGRITKDTWYLNASDDGVLAYKLLIQTGEDINTGNPYNKDQIGRVRLIDDTGYIYAPAFYNYLTAWHSADFIAYSGSMANLYPEPTFWMHSKSDHSDLIVPKSHPIKYAQIAFYLTNLSSTEEIISVVKEMRAICEKFSELGLPNFPNGVPFTYWEQYINLRYYLILAILCVLLVTFIVITILLLNPWAAAIVVVVLGVMLVELFGFMGLNGVKLSAIPAVILIVSVGIGVEFTVHICVGFITSIGSRNKRMQMSLQHTMAPVVHGAISTLLGILMLVGAEFDFIVKYVFDVLLALVVIGLLNGLVLLPVLLSFLGPRGEVIPKDNTDRISPPTPEPSPRLRERQVRPMSRRVYPRMPSDISLTTITEEPSQYSSHEVIVQPEVVVETTMIPMGATNQEGSLKDDDRSSSCSSNKDDTNSNQNIHSNISRHSSPPLSVTSMPAQRHVTRVKATTTVKVEVHTPLPGAVEQEHIYKSKRRKAKNSEHSCNNSDSDSNGSYKS